MKNVNQLKAGSLLSYVNLFISCIIPFFYTPIMLGLLGQEEYGLYSLSNSVVGYLNLLNLGMGTAVIRYITRARASGDTDGVRRFLGLFFVIYSGLAVLVLAGGAALIQLSGTVFGKGLSAAEIEKLRILIIVMSVHTAISFPLGVYASAAVAYEQYVYNKLICIAETLLAPVINLAILYAGYGAVGITAVGLPICILNAFLYGVYCAKRLHIYPVFRNMPTYILKELVGFCTFVFLSSIVDMLYWATDKVLIGAVLGTAAVAVYNIGGTFTSILQNMAHAISNVFSTRINMMVAKDAPRTEISELLTRVGRLQYLVVSLILSGYITFGKAFLHLWVGDLYADAYWVALMTMIPLSVPLIQNIAFATILADNKHRFRSIVYAIIAVMNVVSTYLVLPRYGILGAAACTAIAFVLGQGIIMNIYYHRVTGLDIPAFWRNIGKMSIVPGIMILAGMLLVKYVLPMTSLWWFLAWVIVYTVIFALLSWLFSMNPYEKDLVLGLVRKVLPRKEKE